MVDILLASYNGAKYIESQINSIISQSYKDWRLIIHDDGSTDNTVEIVKMISKRDGRIELIEDKHTFCKPGMNFIHLLNYSTSDFVMFCDQDDIWFDNKIELMLSEIKKKDQSIPQVVYSNSYVWKPEKGIMGNATLYYPKTLEDFLFLNSGMQGCVAIFNKEMVSEMLKWRNMPISMHDHLLHLLGITIGNVTYIPQSLMLYRNHGKNATGETRTKFTIRETIQNLSIPVIDSRHYNTIKIFIQLYNSKLTDRHKGLIAKYLKIPSMTKLKIISTILKYNFKIYGSSLKLIAKFILKPTIA